MKIELRHEMHPGPVVDYIVTGKGIGNQDLAVQQTASDSAYNRTNRVYWSGKGKDREGHWNTNVATGLIITAIVVNIDNDGEVISEVSDPIEFTV